MAILNGPDLSSYQESLNLNNVPYDFAMIKATEGNSYVNPACDTHYQEAKANGKRRGVYHFFDFGVDPVVQAQYFVNNIQGYVNDAILALDWEGQGVENIDQALAFLNEVERLTGVKPLIYMSEWVENAYDWSQVVAGNFGLWIAKYSNWELNNNAGSYDMSNAGTPPNVTHWDFYIMWQWTSTGRLPGYAGNLDCDIFYGDTTVWDAYATAHAVNPAPQPQTVVLPPTVVIPVATVPADPAPVDTPVTDVPTGTLTPPVESTPAPSTPTPGSVVTPTPVVVPTPKAIDVVVPTKKGNTMDNAVNKATTAVTKVEDNADAIASVVTDVTEVKAGWKTSEFWVKLAVDASALTGGLFESHTWETRSAALLTVLVTTVAYIWSRASIKKAALTKS